MPLASLGDICDSPDGTRFVVLRVTADAVSLVTVQTESGAARLRARLLRKSRIVA
jgi:hypothetical protein